MAVRDFGSELNTPGSVVFSGRESNVQTTKTVTIAVNVQLHLCLWQLVWLVLLLV